MPIDNPENYKLGIKCFDIDQNVVRLKCPFCDGVPHLVKGEYGRHIPHSNTSGFGILLEYECENGHQWLIQFSDENGGTDITAVKFTRIES